MDIEKIDYILQYSSNLMSREEKLAWRHYSTIVKRGKNDISEFSDSRREMFLRQNWLTDNPNALELLKDGADAFRKNTAERILADNGENIVFNYCPKCDKLTRTPRAKQCRFCNYNWH
ncbi:hypothetical protein [Flavivirga spongiicola]|uniref:Uncharacterized protein n=1 Tax=Flavivirga spongiicola TaxID=421621 RepID=A0ABU7XWC4_9FLAO|nr:hypothetical protein [Flavivirga sp. MEBiC05379]MDO5979877.1 hypothetical protein [Flavivirga sp. MEBiC05379]